MKYELIPTELPKIDFSLEKELLSIENDIIKQQLASIDKILEESARNNSIPPIKGKITKEKTRYRGLKIIKSGNKIWLQQRDKIISPIIEIGYNLNLPISKREI